MKARRSFKIIHSEQPEMVGHYNIVYEKEITWCNEDGSMAKDKYGWDIEPIYPADQREALKRYEKYRRDKEKRDRLNNETYLEKES